MTKYVFKQDSVLSIKAADKASPQQIGDALEAITEKAKGNLTPQAIVDAARGRNHVLHKHFEWDNTIAAEKYRLEQARSIVQAIHVEATETESGYARAFLSIRDKAGTSYRSLTEVLQSADLQAKVLAAAERDLLAFEGRYRTLTDICTLIRSVREEVAARRKVGSDSRPLA